MIYGYARVSSTDQNLDRQLDTLKGFDCDVIYSDKMSGKDFNRNEYQKLKENLKNGDLLIIKSIDRLGRNYDMIIDEWRNITHNIGADIFVVDMPLIDTRDKEKGLTGKFISDLVLQILSYVAETERNNIKQRQAEGIRIAKEKGKHFGRPKLKIPSNFEIVANQYINGEISLNKALQECSLKRSTFFSYLNITGIRKTEHKLNYKYILTGDFINKTYNSKSKLLKDVNISPQTLKKYFAGEKTIINKMGLKIERGGL